MEKEELDLQNKLRNINNIKQLLSEGMYPGKFSVTLIGAMQFMDEIGEGYQKSLAKYQPTLNPSNQNQNRKQKRALKKKK